MDATEWIKNNLPVDNEQIKLYHGRFKLIHGTALKSADIKLKLSELGYECKKYEGFPCYMKKGIINNTGNDVFDWILSNKSNLSYSDYVKDKDEKISENTFEICLKVAGYEKHKRVSGGRSPYGGRPTNNRYHSENISWVPTMPILTSDDINYATAPYCYNPSIYILQLSEDFAKTIGCEMKNMLGSSVPVQRAYKYGMCKNIGERLNNYVGSQWKLITIIPVENKNLSAVEDNLKQYAKNNKEYKEYINLTELILTSDIAKYIQHVKDVVKN